MSTKIIVDPGSTHMGKIEYAKEAINLASDLGCWGVKFQLFRNEPDNVELPREWWSYLKGYAGVRIKLFASVRDKEDVELLTSRDAPYIKFAYPHRNDIFSYNLKRENVIVSCPPIEMHKFEGMIRLFCVPEYPVLYEVDFEGVLKKFPYEGISDHTCGWEQTKKAVKLGVGYIEKHITLDHSDITCPDHYFALSPKELTNFTRWVGLYESGRAVA